MDENGLRSMFRPVVARGSWGDSSRVDLSAQSRSDSLTISTLRLPCCQSTLPCERAQHLGDVVGCALTHGTSSSDPSRRAYFWIPSGDNPPDRRPTANELMCKPDDEKLYIERKEWVRIRVEEEFFNDVSPTSGKAPPPPPAPNPDGSAPQPPVVESAERDAQAPYRINVSCLAAPCRPFETWTDFVFLSCVCVCARAHPTQCSMTESGTGVLYWWDEDGEEEEGAEEGDEG